MTEQPVQASLDDLWNLGLATAPPPDTADHQPSVTDATAEADSAARGLVERAGPAVGTLPADAEPVDDVDGYYVVRTDGTVTVYGPDATVVATAEHDRSSFVVGQVDGVPIHADRYGRFGFPVVAAHQHRARSLPPEQRDRVRVEIVPDSTARVGYVVEVHGTTNGDPRDDRAVKDIGHLLWSGRKQARVSGRAWTERRVRENVARMLAEFVRQGRHVVVSTRDATAPQQATPVAAPAQPDPQELTDEDLLAAVQREDARVGHGIHRDETAAARYDVLKAEQQARVLARIAAAPDTAAMSDADLAAESRWLSSRFAHAFDVHSDGDKTRKARHTAVTDEQQQRLGRTLLDGPAPAELDDGALSTGYDAAQSVLTRLSRNHPLRAELIQRIDGLRGEMAGRRVRGYRQRVKVRAMTLDELVAESHDLEKIRHEPALHDRSDVESARRARLAAVEKEIDRREGVRFSTELARTTTEGHSSYRQVSIDGIPRSYGTVTGRADGFTARVDRVYPAEDLGIFPTRPAAIAAIVHHYDKNPATLPQRTWGRPRRVDMPVTARTELLGWLRQPGHADTAERRRLAEILDPASIPGQEKRPNRITGKTMTVYPFDIEEGLLGELVRVAEHLTAELHTRAADPDRDRTDRDTAKRRIPVMGAALHEFIAVRDATVAAGRDVDRRALDDNQVAAQLAALAGSVDPAREPGHEEGDRDDREPVQQPGPAALGTDPPPGAGGDERPEHVLRPVGPPDPRGGDRGGGGTDRSPDPGAALPRPGGPAQPDPGHRRAAGTGADAARAGAGRADNSGNDRDVARFRPDPADVVRGPLARATANLAAIQVLTRLDRDGAWPTREDKQVLARWSGWGSVPMIFMERPDEKNPIYGQGGSREGRHGADLGRWEQCTPVRTGLRELLDPFAWAAASRATLSAHYTPPGLATAMWDGLAAFGFDGGEVLEAGCGAGAFIGAAPEHARLTGVELDPVTARICQTLYPHATVLAESFADTDAPTGAFDAAIGNVPFARVPFTERRYGAAGHSLHNGFLIKELALVRPGGLVLAVTSRWTLDADDDAARRAIARHGDLVAAYRLPAGTFADTADTDVVADVLVLRRRPADQPPADQGWLTATSHDIDGTTHTVSSYFTAHPEHVLGELATTSGTYGPTLTVTGDPARAAEQLRAAIRRTAVTTIAAGYGYQPHPDGPDRAPLRLQTARDKHATDYTGRLYTDEHGRIWQHINGADPVEAICSDANTGQLLALMRLRDTATELKELDRTGDDPDRAEHLRAQLRAQHSDYTETYGPLSRPRQTRLAASTDVRAQARAEGRPVRDDERTPTAWGWFRDDPDAATVLGLETWDPHHDAPVLSEVLTHRPGTRRANLEHTDDPKVALTAVLGATGRVDLDRVADLLGTTPDEARRRLGTDVFDNPTTGRLEHAGSYLSGAVRRKLDEATAAAATDPTYAVNVAALETVQPPEKRIGQFTPQLGAHWIPAELVQGFLRQYLADPTLRVDHNDRYGWSLYAGKIPDAVNAIKGTDRRSALHIARAVLGRSSLLVEDSVVTDKGTVVSDVNEDASRAVRQRADAMRSAFEEYLTSDTTRVALLTDAYNRIMNGHVVRNYDGLSPTLAGFTDRRTPHPHQLAGAARMQFERGVLLAHEVGLGKTTTMILGSQALKASGQITKPIAVVQRHLARQWVDEARLCYPNADIRLITSDLLAGDERRRTLEWLRSNTPDLTIVTEDAFVSVKMSPEFQEWYEFQEIDQLREQILRERGVPDNALAVIKLEQRLATAEARLQRNAAPLRTPGELYFDDLGCDYLLVDEVHRFKGVGFRSRLAGGSDSATRAIDLHQKLTYLHREAEQHGGRPTVTGGTGTPLTNSIAEQYTMLALISPWVLEAYGVAGADLWAETFGQRVPRIEMAPDGSGLKVVERFSRFINKTAMKTMWGLTADTKTAADVGIPRPRIAGGGPQLHLIEPTADQRARLKALVARGEAIHAGAVTRAEDNMLAVATTGRAVACDPRLLDADAEPGTKLTAVADWFATRYHATKDRIYPVSATDPTPHPVPGALQIGFLNLGTPGGSNKGRFNAYAELRRLCADRGVPAEKIAFVQDHNHNPDQLAELYRRCRDGDVAIILASTETMGTGANIQHRAVALAHIDLDWTPAGMEQRNGRIVRYGNQNDEVEIGIFALRGSMDSWQAGLLAAKAEGLRDIQRPTLSDDDSTDTVAELGDTEWDYATMQAEIGGNPYLGQLMNARIHLAGLEADRRNHAADRLRQADLLAAKTTEADLTRTAIARRDQVLPQIRPVRGDNFQMTIGQQTHHQRGTAATALRQTVTSALMQHRTPGTGSWQHIGQLGGLTVAVQAELTADGKLQARVGFPDLRHSDALYAVDDLVAAKTGTTMVQRLITALDKAADHQAVDRQRLPGLDAEIALLTEQQHSTDFAARIDHARRRVDLLDDIVAAIAERDKLPELRAEDLDPSRYPTADEREKVVAARESERAPLQAKVDAAAARLVAFDRDHPDPQATTARPDGEAEGLGEATASPTEPGTAATADGTVNSQTNPDSPTPSTSAVEPDGGRAVAAPQAPAGVRTDADGARIAAPPAGSSGRPDEQQVRQATDATTPTSDQPGSGGQSAIDTADPSATTMPVDRSEATVTTQPGTADPVRPVDTLHATRAGDATVAVNATPDARLVGGRADEPATTGSTSAPVAARLTTPEDRPGKSSAPSPWLAGIDAAAAVEFSGGVAFTSTNRIRGPLRSVKVACTAVVKTRQWNPGGSQQKLAEAIAEFKTLTVATDPVHLLGVSLALAREAEAVRQRRRTTAVDPVLSMVHDLSRISTGFARNLVATARTPNRWQRLFDTPPPAALAGPTHPRPRSTPLDRQDTLPGLTPPPDDNPDARADPPEPEAASEAPTAAPGRAVSRPAVTGPDHEDEAGDVDDPDKPAAGGDQTEERPTASQDLASDPTPAQIGPDSSQTQPPRPGWVLATFTPDDQRRVRNAVADHGPTWYSAPVVGGSLSNVARYIAEGEGPDSLARAMGGRHHWRTIWTAIAEVLDENPGIVQNRSPGQAKADAEARTARVDDLVKQAELALSATDLPRVATLLDEANTIDPDHRLPGPNGNRSLGIRLSDIRERVRAELDGPTVPEPNPNAGSHPNSSPAATAAGPQAEGASVTGAAVASAAPAPKPATVPARDPAPPARLEPPDTQPVHVDGNPGEGLASEPAAEVSEMTTSGHQPGGPATAGPAPFGLVDQVRLRNAVLDEAARYFGGPLGLDTDAAVRYVCEGHLHDLVGRHGFTAVWDAVAAYVDANPDVLTRTAHTRQLDRVARAEQAGQLAKEANAAFRRHEFDQANHLVTQAELVDPDHRAGRAGYTWDEIRQKIEQRRAATAVAERDTQQQPAPAPGAEDQARAVLESPPPAGQAETTPTAVPAEHDEAPARGQPATAVPPTPSAPSASPPGHADASDQAIIDRWARLITENGRTGMRLHRPGHAPQPVSVQDGTELFSRMIVTAGRTGEIPARLSWHGVYISVGRTDHPDPRLRIALGHRDAYIDLSLRQAWPAPHTHSDLLRRIIGYIDTRTRQSQHQLGTVTTSPARSTVARPNPAPPSSSAAHAFPHPARPGPAGPRTTPSDGQPVDSPTRPTAEGRRR